MTDAVPTIRCRQIGRYKGKRWRFWCVHCQAYHMHSPEPGHRQPHCHTEKGRAAYPRGYVLKLEEEID